jgi:hypothetical protein
VLEIPVVDLVTPTPVPPGRLVIDPKAVPCARQTVVGETGSPERRPQGAGLKLRENPSYLTDSSPPRQTVLERRYERAVAHSSEARPLPESRSAHTSEQTPFNTAYMPGMVSPGTMPVAATTPSLPSTKKSGPFIDSDNEDDQAPPSPPVAPHPITAHDTAPPKKLAGLFASLAPNYKISLLGKTDTRNTSSSTNTSAATVSANSDQTTPFCRTHSGNVGYTTTSTGSQIMARHLGIDAPDRDKEAEEKAMCVKEPGRERQRAEESEAERVRAVTAAAATACLQAQEAEIRRRHRHAQKVEREKRRREAVEAEAAEKKAQKERKRQDDGEQLQRRMEDTRQAATSLTPAKMKKSFDDDNEMMEPLRPKNAGAGLFNSTDDLFLDHGDDLRSGLPCLKAASPKTRERTMPVAVMTPTIATSTFQTTTETSRPADVANSPFNSTINPLSHPNPTVTTPADASAPTVRKRLSAPAAKKLAHESVSRVRSPEKALPVTKTVEHKETEKLEKQKGAQEGAAAKEQARSDREKAKQEKERKAHEEALIKEQARRRRERDKREREEKAHQEAAAKERAKMQAELAKQEREKAAELKRAEDLKKVAAKLNKTASLSSDTCLASRAATTVTPRKSRELSNDSGSGSGSSASKRRDSRPRLNSQNKRTPSERSKEYQRKKSAARARKRAEDRLRKTNSDAGRAMSEDEFKRLIDSEMVGALRLVLASHLLTVV